MKGNRIYAAVKDNWDTVTKVEVGGNTYKFENNNVQPSVEPCRDDRPDWDTTFHQANKGELSTCKHPLRRNKSSADE